MKAWPGQKDRYIVVACSTKATPDNTAQPNNCSKTENPKNKIIVAVLNYDGSGLPTLAATPYIETVASDENGYVGRIKSAENGYVGNIKEDTLAKSAFYLKDDINEVLVGNLKRLDFAHYQLNSKTVAFGIRFDFNNMYGRGNAVNQLITLFAIINNKLLPVFKSQIYTSTYMAPPLDSNGRVVGHEIDEKIEYVLSILPHQTNGFSDIKRTQKGARNKKGKIYRWDSQKLSYQ